MKKERKVKVDEKLMAEGYQAMAEEHKQFADMALEIAHEVIPEWRCLL